MTCLAPGTLPTLARRLHGVLLMALMTVAGDRKSVV